MTETVAGRTVKAEEALQIGLVNKVIAAENLIAEANKLLAEITALAPLALKSIMTVIDEGYDMPLPEAFALEASHFGLCCATADKEEGVKAFVEKRTATFNGH